MTAKKVHKTVSVYVWSHYQRLNKAGVWVRQTSPLVGKNQVDLCQAVPASPYLIQTSHTDMIQTTGSTKVQMTN